MGFFNQQVWGRTLSILTMTVALLAATAPAQQKGTGTFTDKRDGKVYKTVVIGGKKWMAENLNVKTGSSWCYGDQESNCKKYGRLYVWSTAAKMACPDGWHLPTRDEWGELAKATGGTGAYGAGGTAGTKLKAATVWDVAGSGTDQFGFAALPAGFRFPKGNFSGAGFETAGSAGNLSNSTWWSVTQTASGGAYVRDVSSNEKNLGEFEEDKDKGFSVRCVEGEATESVIDIKPKQPKASDGGSAGAGGQLIDHREDRLYKTVKIGGKTWMAENLNYETVDSWCYQNSDDNCAKYGRLYKWSAAKRACPDDWHLPTRAEWSALVKAAGGDNAGTKLKSKNGWDRNGNGTDNYGFSALPAGYRSNSGKFGFAGEFGAWWTATEYKSGLAYYREIWWADNGVGENNNDDSEKEGDDDDGTADGGYSVRCVRNE